MNEQSNITEQDSPDKSSADMEEWLAEFEEKIDKSTRRTILLMLGMAAVTFLIILAIRFYL